MKDNSSISMRSGNQWWRMVALALCVTTLGPVQSRAANSFWTNATASGTFSDAANWAGGVPGAADNAFFTNANTYTVDFSADALNANAYFISPQLGQVTLDIGGGNTWTLGSGMYISQAISATNLVVLSTGTLAVTNVSNNAQFTVGDLGNGQLLLSGGSLQANRMYVAGNNAGANGTFGIDSGAAEFSGSMFIGYHSGAAGTFWMNGGSLVLTNADQGIMPGFFGTGSMIMSNGSALVRRVDVGTVAGSQGALNIEGGFLTLRGENYPSRFGLGGSGALNLRGGALLITNTAEVLAGTTAGGNGVITVTGGGATNYTHLWLGSGVGGTGSFVQTGGTWRQDMLFQSFDVGAQGVGSMTMGGGEMIVSSPGGYFNVGNNNGSVGTLTITNGTLTITNVGNGLIIGRMNGSKGTLTLGGGTFNVHPFAKIGGENNDGTRAGTGTVVQTGGTWQQLGTLYIGNSGVGTYNQQGGTFTNNGGVYVGNHAGSSGQLTVSGNDTFFAAQGLYVGSNAVTKGVGHVLVTNGGVLQANTLMSGFNGSGSISNRGGVFQFTISTPTITANSAGSIVVEDGTVSFLGINNAPTAPLAGLTYAGNNSLRLVDATNSMVASYTFETGNAPTYAGLQLNNGRFQATTVTFDPGSSLTGNGVVASDNVTNHGTIAPGFPAGSLTFTSNLVLGASSVLQMEIGGNTPSAYDQLIVNGSLTLTGTLSIAMINSFSPTVGETFTLIDHAGTDPVAGHFTGLTNNAFIDASGNGIDAFFRIQYDGGSGNDVILIATIPEPGTLALTLAGVILLGRRRARHGS